MNPLIPSVLDGLMMALVALAFALATWAIVELVREKGRPRHAVVRLILIILVPLIGAGVSLYWSRVTRHANH